MARKQIVVSDSTDEKIHRLAAQRGLSESEVIAMAVTLFPDSDQLAGMRRFAGIIQGDGPSNLSERVDEIYDD